jgi:hypothetical protein
MTGTLRGFGVMFDVRSGTTRQWYVGADGIKRWMDDTPVDESPRYEPTEAGLAALGGGA